MKILGISGSPTAPSRSTWLMQSLLRLISDGEDQHEVLETVDLRTLNPSALLNADLSSADVSNAVKQVALADIVVVATPVYKAAYSGLLKVFLDLLPQEALRGKSVVPLATGGSVAHLLALDYALKPVLGALGARHFFDSIYGADSQFTKHALGVYDIEQQLTVRLAQAQVQISRWSVSTEAAALDSRCKA